MRIAIQSQRPVSPPKAISRVATLLLLVIDSLPLHNHKQLCSFLSRHLDTALPISGKDKQTNMADKLRAQQELEALQSRHLGTGSADTTAEQWATNLSRDTLASYLGHPPQLQYMAMGLGITQEEMRIKILDRIADAAFAARDRSNQQQTQTQSQKPAAASGTDRNKRADSDAMDTDGSE